jgi:hypothetical protein
MCSANFVYRLVNIRVDLDFAVLARRLARWQKEILTGS